MAITSKNRNKLRAQQETGYAQSAAMQKEAEEMINDGHKIKKGIYAGLTLVSIMTKTWISLLDSKERLDHNLGHGQTKFIYEPFLIGGEYGQYPRADTFSMRQKARCRCYSLVGFRRKLII